MLDPSLAPILASLARYAVLLLTVMAVLDRFGVQMTSLIAVIGAGDTISILGTDGTRGTVTEIGLFHTTITAVDHRSLSLRILKMPEPIVAVSSLNEYSVTMLLRLWVPYTERNPVSWSVLEELHARMRKEGIAIAVTRQAVSERNENGLDESSIGHEEETDAVPSKAKH